MNAGPQSRMPKEERNRRATKQPVFSNELGSRRLSEGCEYLVKISLRIMMGV